MFLLSILTGGGLLGGIAMLVLKPLLRRKAADLAGKVPWQGWAVLAFVVLAIGGAWWVNHKISAAYSDGRAQGRIEANADWQLALDAAHADAVKWRTAYEATSAFISTRLREQHDQDLRDNARLAGDLGLRGPGQAAARCGPGGAAQLAGGACGREPAPAGPDAPADPVPAGDGFAVVPWGWLVDRAREHDDLLAENQSWRSWHHDQRNAYDEAVAQLRAVQVLPPAN